MALFLFLVCAVVGSVVLTAGTAAAGRRAQIEVMDQKYYAVNSAAELFRDQIAGKSVTITRTKTETYSTTFSLVKNENGTSSRSGSGAQSESDITYTNSMNNSSYDSKDLLQAAVLELVKDYNVPAKYGFDSSIQRYTLEEKKNFTIVHDADKLPEGVTADDLKVDVTMVIENNGDLTFTFSSGSEKNQYAVREHFQMHFDETTEQKSTDGDPEILPVTGHDNEFTESYETTETEIKTGVFTWEYKGVETFTAAPAATDASDDE